MKRHLLSREISLDKPTYLIISTSANALARSVVRAGFSAITIDCFADIDTAQISHYSYQIDLTDANCSDRIIQRINRIIKKNQLSGVIVGSGLENKLDLLKQIQATIPVLVNFDCLTYLNRSPEHFFKALEFEGIPHPPVKYNGVFNEPGWVVKKLAASGGNHIKTLSKDYQLQANEYYQRFIQGQCYSVNFIAYGQSVKQIGINCIWNTDYDGNRFQYTGAISHQVLTQEHQQQIECVLEKITRCFNLVGLCGVDFIIDECNELSIIDINPRPTATYELYENASGELLQAHIDAFTDKQLSKPTISGTQKGHWVVYSNTLLEIPSEVDWPDWVYCRPEPNVLIQPGQPVCMVIAEVENLSDPKSTLLDRKQCVIQMLKKIQNSCTKVPSC